MDDVRAEIEALHAFFVRWFNGECADDARVFAEGLSDRLAPTFTLIPPSGVILDRAGLVEAVREGHGGSSGFGIEIRNVTVRPAGTTDLLIATYEEWQRNARNSTPPDNGRIATAIFRSRPTPGGLEWLHVHETWLPPPAMAEDARG